MFRSVLKVTTRSLPRTTSTSVRRPLSVVPPARFTPTYATPRESLSLSDHDYARISESTMDSLTEYLESHLESLSHLDPSEIDVEYSSGVLTVNLGPTKGTYVINKQPPNKQLGPKRYDFDPVSKKWFYARDGSTLDGLLNEELRGLLQDETVDVDLDVTGGSGQ